MSTAKVLVVDDEALFRSSLARALEGHGYEVLESGTVADALNTFRAFNPDVILLDLMLPDGDGVQVCEAMRRNSDVAIIVLSVIGDEETKVRALDVGADDYLMKPFGTQELLARIRAALRRSAATEIDTKRIGALNLDIESTIVHLNGVELHLTPTEFSLLQLFVENAGRVLRHPFILRSVWGETYVEDTQILRVYVNQLRAKLGDKRGHPTFIRTEPGVGYRFIYGLT